MTYRTIRHQQSMLKAKVASAVRDSLKNVFEKVDIVRVDSQHHQIGAGPVPGGCPQIRAVRRT
jgi:hypothetical protein